MSGQLKLQLEGLCGATKNHVNLDGSKPASELDCDGCSTAHLREFGDCTGVVEGPVNYNNYGEDNPRKIGPEVDVRWDPSNLRYAYHPDDLIEIACLKP